MTHLRQHVMVVDDDPALAAGVGELLTQEGYRVTIAYTGLAAMRKMAARPPDLVILDVQLPDRSGFEVLRQLRSRGFQQKILMLSSVRNEVHKVVGLDAGADDYITKPFSPQELVARVRSHLRERPWRSDLPEVAQGPRRRMLRAIMFMDMEGYSRRINRDEALGLALLEVLRRTVSRAIHRYGGTIIDSPGDAVMAAFESALEAVRCGFMIQRQLDRRNRSVSGHEHIRLRVGIHAGDVLKVGNALRGNTVNIAARLQAIGQPGSLTVSEEVLEAVRGRHPCTVRRIGVRQLKNIRQPKTVYMLRSLQSSARR